MPSDRSPTRLLNPARRWALRELKVRPGQTVIVAGAPVTWTVELVRELVSASGTVIVIAGDRTRAERVAQRKAERGWTNVEAWVATADLPELFDQADRVFLDDPRLIAQSGAVGRILAPLRPAARAAGVCTRGGESALGDVLERHVHAVRRESFYLGAARALWGQRA